MIFKNRYDAGEQLAKRLTEYQNNPEVIVIGLPRGGIPVAYMISNFLKVPLDITCPRKIGAPMNPEYAIGAITETGEGIFNESFEIQEEALEREKQIAQNRLKKYRQGMGPREISGKIVILVDDGLATGFTMKAAILSMQREGANQVIVAVPVAPPDTLEEIKQMADETICLMTPYNFQAVGQFYAEFSQTEDEEVIRCLSTKNL